MRSISSKNLKIMNKFLEKKADNSFFLRIHVKPNSKKQEILIDSDNLTIKVRSKAFRNKANKEILNFIRKKLKISSNQLNIVSGTKNSYKVIQITFLTEINEEEVIKKLLV